MKDLTIKQESLANTIRARNPVKPKKAPKLYGHPQYSSYKLDNPKKDYDELLKRRLQDCLERMVENGESIDENLDIWCPK